MKSMLKAAVVPVAAVAAFAGGVAVKAYADQPYMHQALDQLSAARATLAAGAPDKGGHRVRAMRLVDSAIAEVRMGISYAR